MSPYSLSFMVELSGRIFVAMSLTSISNFCGYNFGGGLILDYAPVNWLDQASYEPVFNNGNLVYNLLFVEGNWLQMPYADGTLNWIERPSDGEQGVSYIQEVSLILKQMRVDVERQFDVMSGPRFVLRYADRNGKIWLIGTPQSGLDFKATATTATNSSGLNSYQVRFSGETKHRAVGFVPVFNI